MSSRLLDSPFVREKVIIGDFRSDIVADQKAEAIIKLEFPEIEIITSVEGNKLIPVGSLIKLSERLKSENDQVQLEHQNLLTEATAKANEEGYNNGYRAGLDTGHQEAQKVIDNFALLIKDATAQREILYNEARHKILELVIEIARKITFSAAKIDPEVTAGIISGVIDHLVDKTKIKVKVHPDHHPLIEQQIDRFKGDSTAIKSIKIEPDPRVRYGGCYVETPTGDIDARVESQMDIIAGLITGNESGQ